MPDETLIEISHLDFAYGQALALKHVHLSVQAGSVLGVIGPNGGGKTTLMRLMLGFLKPTHGKISIAGLAPEQAIRRGDLIGYLPQNSEVTERFPISVRQMVRLGLVGKTGILRGYARADLQFANGLMERAGLADFADSPVGELSGGQLQRALIARALAPRPRVLILDEPTTGIDAGGQQRFIDFLLELKRDLRLTVVIVSHDLRTVSAMADRIACLNVTLHYHDVPHRLPEELAHRMFACDLEAMGIRRASEPACEQCDRIESGD